ncbi:hypothetical protein FACS189444_6160 [Spirochaetia bacterium]|nr:hypothetical protein FACS189444_6160 [Spirochaetia bacterium]
MVYSPKMWYAASNRFSIAGERIITERIRQLIRPALTPAKKCIVLDLDNTLWGGVIGEDGVRGILLDDHGEGARFYDFQKILLEINNRGVLLAIISKNNVEDVEEVFLHPQMLLKKNNFSAMAVGWNSKSENIVQIAHEINIGLDSLVFIDDNPVEREEMRQNRPEVVIADFPGDTTHLYQFAVDMYNQYFYTWDISSEDIHKTKIYEENAKRLVKMKDFSSIEDFLVDMDIKLSVKKVDAELLVRVYQMIQKTNQFNVTSKRYSEEELVKMLGDDKTVMLLGNVQDKYGDNGNSILLIARMVSNHEAEIDSFLMSCRIMNRTIEFGFLYAAEKVLQSMGADVIYAVYFQTSKNSPAEKFFDDAGYELITSNPDTKRYRLIPHVCNEEKRKKYYGAMLLSCTIKALEL